MGIPIYDKPKYPEFQLTTTQTIHMMDVVRFLKFVVERDELEIAEYLNQMRQDPFFLVAATDLGKTVVVPIHDLIRQIQHAGAHPHPEPHIWVVEPRIPIADDQADFMNGLWSKFQRQQGRRNTPPLFGCITSASGRVNREAPIKFITTGIFGILARQDQLRPERDRVIIDEAHVTVEQSPEVELGIALAKRAGITVDYMSATVDITGLSESLGVANIIRADKARYTIWKHNLLRPMDDALSELVRETLIQPNPASPYFPQVGDFAEAEAVRQAVLETGRAHGLLVVVNSFAGQQSDTQRLANRLRELFPGLPVFQLASEVIRDPGRCDAFKQQLRQIETDQQNYVILATSVVEMGITFPTLDFVASMDSGYDQETIGETTFPVVAPLGVNALLQRIGRVGRRRPGIAYISREVSADYADLDNNKLNHGTLVYEPIQFPMANASLMPLAYYACQQNWSTGDEGEEGGLTKWVTNLNLPSRLHEDPNRMEYLRQQIDNLEQLGLVKDGSVTPLGERMERWVGQSDLAYAVQLQQRFEAGASLTEVLFWIVATALSNTPLVTLRASGDYFVDYNGTHPGVKHAIDLWSGHEHEDTATFHALAWAMSIAPSSLHKEPGQVIGQSDDFDLARFTSMIGLDARKVAQAIKRVREVWHLFCRINRRTEAFNELFRNSKQPELCDLEWLTKAEMLELHPISEQLCQLYGTLTVELYQERDMVKWVEFNSGSEGQISQHDSPVELIPGCRYTARLVPSRQSQEDEVTWQLAHVGQVQEHDVADAELAPDDTQAQTEEMRTLLNQPPASTEDVRPRSTFYPSFPPPVARPLSPSVPPSEPTLVEESQPPPTKWQRLRRWLRENL